MLPNHQKCLGMREHLPQTQETFRTRLRIERVGDDGGRGCPGCAKRWRRSVHHRSIPIQRIRDGSQGQKRCGAPCSTLSEWQAVLNPPCTDHMPAEPSRTRWDMSGKRTVGVFVEAGQGRRSPAYLLVLECRSRGPEHPAVHLPKVSQRDLHRLDLRPAQPHGCFGTTSTETHYGSNPRRHVQP